MNTPSEEELYKSIAKQIADYREGVIDRPNADHVVRWAAQFPPEARHEVLAETDHILKSMYFSRERIKRFLRGLTRNEKLVGDEPYKFWNSANLLRLQPAGKSQSDMLTLFGEVLADELKIDIANIGGGKGPFIYVDDCLFTGNTVRRDILPWLEKYESNTPSRLEVIYLGHHTGGQFYSSVKIDGAAAKKKITPRWWRVLEIEDRKYYINSSEVLRPASLPDDPLVQEYVAELEALGRPVILRKQGAMSSKGPFLSVETRDIIERELLLAGLRMRSACENPATNMRPLGYTYFDTLGFGALLATYRNCANNCPLALWWGDANAPYPLSEWYPLLPRKAD